MDYKNKYYVNDSSNHIAKQNDRYQRFPSEQQSCLQNSLSSYKDYKSLYYKYKKKYLNLKNKILIPVDK